MPRFVGRGLPSILDEIRDSNTAGQLAIPATEEDLIAIRQWAAEIDSWFTEATVISESLGLSYADSSFYSEFIFSTNNMAELSLSPDLRPLDLLPSSRSTRNTTCRPRSLIPIRQIGLTV